MTQHIPADQVIFTFQPMNPADAPYMVEPGEVFTVDTRDALNGAVRPGMAHVPPLERVNPATGPIAVRGVQPGQTLAIDVLDIQPVGQGYLTHGGRPRFYRSNQPWFDLTPGVRLSAAPMIGTIGVMPAQGDYATKLSGDYGGNMDARDVADGATLYLQAQLTGGLLATGDVHACQGDGEVCGQGIETAARLTLRVRPLARGWAARPCIRRDGWWMLVVTAPTLDEAARMATDDMAALLAARSAFDREQALLWLGQVGDLRIAQIVNRDKTVRMAVPLADVPWLEDVQW